MSKILVIGAQNIDIYAKSKTEYTLHDSNKTFIHLAQGGVGQNIALNLSRLNNDVHFITVFGDDYFSMIAKTFLDNTKINYKKSLTLTNKSNSIYMGIMDQKNDLFLGLNDMDILQDLSITYLRTLHNYIDSFKDIVIDNNLDEEVIEYLLKTYNYKNTYIDAVSASKAIKLKKITNLITYLKVNKLELNVLSSKESIDDQINDLQRAGIKNVIITDKEQDCLVVSNHEKIKYQPLIKENIVNASGAGDGFFAGFIHDIIINKDTLHALQYGNIVAYITLDSNDSTNKDLSIKKVEETYEELFRN